MTAAQASSSQETSTAGSVACNHCGTVTDEPGLTWMRDRDPRRGPVWYCPQCARRNLRAIEAKLDENYW